MLIQLTYYRSPKIYGTSSRATDKVFYLSNLSVIRITPYKHSNKLLTESGAEMEVVESLDYLMRELNRSYIMLTYCQEARRYGRSKCTGKKFFLSADVIERITPYRDAVKLSLTTGEDVEVSEGLETIFRRIQGALGLPMPEVDTQQAI